MRGAGLGVITVLHLITGLDTGGAEMTLAKLVERSDRTRLRHVVVSMKEPGPIGTRIAALDVPVFTLGMTSGVPDPRGLASLVKILRREAPGVVQSWLYHADLIGLIGAKLARVPVIWNLRSSSPLGDLNPGTAAVARACARLSRFPAAVVTNSEAAMSVHAEFGYRPKEWVIIPNGFDTDQFVPDRSARADVRLELGIARDSVLIGLVARYDPLKDHASFLHAASMVRHSSNPEFLLVGPGVSLANAGLRGAIEKLGLCDRVHLVGERRDIPRLTAALDIATCSSYGESFPNIIGEAMSCAVPCVVTDVGDSARIVGDTGRVVPPRNPKALAAAWQELLELGPEGRTELGLKARARVEALYSLDSVVRQYEELYERLARKR